MGERTETLDAFFGVGTAGFSLWSFAEKLDGSS